MANEGAAGGQIGVIVCYALPGYAWQRDVRLPDGATVEDALAASGFAQAFPVVKPWEAGVGIFGRATEPHARLADVARLEVGQLDYSFSSREDGRQGVAAAVQLAPGANAMQTAKAVKARLAELSQNFPAGIQYAVPYDT